MLPDNLVSEMKNAFKRSQEFLDLELQTEKQSLEMQEKDVTAKNSMIPQQQVFQIVVGVDQAEKMIGQGWRFVATLPGEKAVFENFGTGKRDV